MDLHAWSFNSRGSPRFFQPMGLKFLWNYIFSRQNNSAGWQIKNLKPQNKNHPYISVSTGQNVYLRIYRFQYNGL